MARPSPSRGDAPANDAESIAKAEVLLRRSIVLLHQARQRLKKAERAAVDPACRTPAGCYEASDVVDSECVEKLYLVARSLDETFEIAAAKGDDERMEVTLQQYEKAGKARDDATALCRVEQEAIAGLRSDILVLDRWTTRDSSHMRSLREPLGAGAPERPRALEERCGDGTWKRMRALEERFVTAQAAVVELRSESDELSRVLSESRSRVQDSGSLSRRLHDEHHHAVAENRRARLALGDDPNLECYKRTKEHERMLVDGDLAQARAEAEEEIERLEARWAAQRARYDDDVQELHEDVQHLQGQFADSRSQADSNLRKQSSQHDQVIEEVEGRCAAEVRHLEEFRGQKAAALRSQVAQSRHYLQEAAKSAQRHLEVQRGEVRTVYRTRVQMEEARCQNEILTERRAVDWAKKERETWEKRAQQMREGYRAHTVKSKNYVKSLDPKRRKELSELWERG